MGKGDRKRRQKARRRAEKAKASFPGYVPPKVTPIASEGRSERPTAERLKRGKWALPQGMGKHEQPAVDLEADEIGRLYEKGDITTHQEQAARTAQQAHADYSAELGLSLGRSCLDMSPVGHDDSDGNPEAMAAWRNITGKLTYWQEGALVWTAIHGHEPGNLPLLCEALDAIAGAKRMAAE